MKLRFKFEENKEHNKEYDYIPKNGDACFETFKVDFKRDDDLLPSLLTKWDQVISEVKFGAWYSYEGGSPRYVYEGSIYLVKMFKIKIKPDKITIYFIGDSSFWV
jgi:hypothetical protein